MLSHNGFLLQLLEAIVMRFQAMKLFKFPIHRSFSPTISSFSIQLPYNFQRLLFAKSHPRADCVLQKAHLKCLLPGGNMNGGAIEKSRGSYAKAH